MIPKPYFNLPGESVQNRFCVHVHACVSMSTERQGDREGGSGRRNGTDSSKFITMPITVEV